MDRAVKSLPVPDNALIVRQDLQITCYQCHLDIVKDIVNNQLNSNIQLGMYISDYLKLQLQSSLLELDFDVEGQNVLKDMGVDKFLPTSDKDYENLYKMIHELEIDLSKYEQ